MMMRNIDRGVAVLLGIFGLLHAYGSLLAYAFLTPELVWAWSATALCLLIAVLNFIRAGRPADGTLAWTCFAADVTWVILALSFAVSEGNLADPRALLHALAAAILAGFAWRTAAAAPGFGARVAA